MFGCYDCAQLTSGKCSRHLITFHPVGSIMPTWGGWEPEQYQTHPFVCPVCLGKGKVPHGFYSAIGVDSYTTSETTPEACRTCWGSGIVWG